MTKKKQEVIDELIALAKVLQGGANFSDIDEDLQALSEQVSELADDEEGA